MKLNIRQFFTILLFLALFFLILRPITDADFWWHLATGKMIVETHQIPRMDPFSFTAAGQEWVAHEWLSELIIYKLFQAGSYGLLIFAFTLLITAAYLFAYLRTSRTSRPYTAGFVVLLCSVASAPLWGVRPQMLSLLFTSIFLYLLDRYVQEKRFKYLIPIPILMVIWVNLHAGYFLGLVIIGIYLAGTILEILSAKRKKQFIPVGIFSLIRDLALCLVAALLATLVNPNGVRILLYPFETLADPAMQAYIQEWYAPDLLNKTWLPLLVILLALLGLIAFGKQRIPLTRILLTLAFGFLALRSMRHVPLFAVVVIPILADLVQGVFPSRVETQDPVRASWLYSLLVFVLLIPPGMRFFQVVRSQEVVEGEHFPASAVDWILENKPEGNLFNSYTWGGYLIWRLAPEYRVYIDGRADLYGPEFFTRFAEVYQAQLAYGETFTKDNINLVLVEPGSGIASSLRSKLDWGVVFEDELSVIFVRD